MKRPIYPAIASGLVVLISSFGPFAETLKASSFETMGLILPILGLLILVLASLPWLASTILIIPIGFYGSYLTVNQLSAINLAGDWGYWSSFWGFLLAAIYATGHISLREEQNHTKKLQRLLPPGCVPFILLLLWQGLVLGFDVPKGIFPSVTHVYAKLVSSYEVLLSDSYVTFVREIFFGFIIGLTAGFTAGVAISNSPFLQRGFLPLAAAFGAVPIVGLAPVLGRAFGVDWESKAAVVVITTFFPVVLNTVSGLTQINPLRLELFKAYAAKPRDIFFKLRLPNAFPFIFNALKLSFVLSVISVIVAEFLIPGPPRGLGQRISLSARQGAYDIVFAAIIVSSLISVMIYGLLSVLERMVTHWHPSFREET